MDRQINRQRVDIWIDRQINRQRVDIRINEGQTETQNKDRQIYTSSIQGVPWDLSPLEKLQLSRSRVGGGERGDIEVSHT